MSHADLHPSFFLCSTVTLTSDIAGTVVIVGSLLNTLNLVIPLATYVYVHAPVGVQFSTNGPDGATVDLIAPISPFTVTNTTAAVAVNIDAAIATTVTLTAEHATGVGFGSQKRQCSKLMQTREEHWRECCKYVFFHELLLSH